MKLDKKQTIILIITIAAVLFLIWQIYDMFSSDTVAAVTTTTHPNTLSSTKAKTITATQTTKHGTSFKVVPKKAKDNITPKLAKQLPRALQIEQQELAAAQQKFIEISQQVELAKMERQLLNEEAGIASARQKIATLTSKSSANSDITTQATLPNSGLWQLVYIDFQHGHFSAVINRDNQYLTVEAGTHLNTSDKIISISKNNLVVSHNKQKYRLNFNGMSPLHG